MIDLLNFDPPNVKFDPTLSPIDTDPFVALTEENSKGLKEQRQWSSRLQSHPDKNLVGFFYFLMLYEVGAQRNVPAFMVIVFMLKISKSNY